MAKDPICDVEVDEETAEFKSQYASQTYYFCSAECQEQQFTLTKARDDRRDLL